MRTATYRFKQFHFAQHVATHKVWVEIVEESTKTFKVKFLQPCPTGRPKGTQIRARKHNVVNITEWRKPFINN